MFPPGREEKCTPMALRTRGSSDEKVPPANQKKAYGEGSLLGILFIENREGGDRVAKTKKGSNPPKKKGVGSLLSREKDGLEKHSD